MKDLMEILNYPLLEFGDTVINIYNIVWVILIFVLARFLTFIVKRIIYRKIGASTFDSGRGMALFQIAKYVILITAIVTGLESLGIHVKFLLAGSAALLVGLGLGLQQTFNDLISGIILLFEGSVTVGDIVEVDGLVAKVKRIRIRVAEVETREGISILVPNSKLTNENVINWSHNRSLTRFSLKVGVAYGSEVVKVKEILENVAQNHSKISDRPVPFARFLDFADSALVFELIFWSTDMFSIENTKSDLRFQIDSKFRQNGVTIPFPQRDLHIKSSDLVTFK